MKPVKVNCSTYIDFGAENNDKDSKYKVVSHVRISIFKKTFLQKVPFSNALDIYY